MKTIEEIVLENKNLIYSIAGYFENYKNKDDLFQVGVIGMINAYNNYDQSVGVRFTTYAYNYILGEMKKYVREDKSIKVSRNLSSLNYKIERAYELLSQKLQRYPSMKELSDYLGIEEEYLSEAINSKKEIKSIDEAIAVDSKELTLHETLPDKQKDINTLIALKEELKKLNPKEQQLLKERYFEDKTQTEIATSLGMSQVQVSRQEQKVLVKLKHNLQ